MGSLVFVGAPSLLSCSNGMSQDVQPVVASSVPACATFSGVRHGGGGYLEGFSRHVVQVAKVSG